MATPLVRLQWSILRKSQLECPRFAASLVTNRHFHSWNLFSDKRNFRTYDKSAKHFLTFSVLFSSIGYILYKWKDYRRERFGILNAILPTVRAKSYFSADVNQNRDRYNFIADVVDVSAPAVVYIEIRDQRRTDFFTGRPITTSNGSGFIVGDDGLILTNAHVVVNKPNTAVKVRLHDGSTFDGIVEDVDMQRDLATVRINKKNLPVMKLGSSANLRPGEFVVAIGSPLSLSNTITSGIVSSVNRQSEELGLHNKRMDYIQTDAAITFGNSGGPLVNLDGEAIGINVMKVTAGISFAIPIDYAKEFLQKAEARRKNKGTHRLSDSTHKRFLGITMLSLTPDIIYEIQQKSSFLKTPVSHGVLVWQVMIGSPAHRAGLHTGDIITHVNKEAVVAASNIYKYLEKPGIMYFTVMRDGTVLEIAVEPEDVS